MVGDVVRTEVVLHHADDFGGGRGKALLAIGRIVVVRRNGPPPAAICHLKRQRRSCRVIPLHDLQRGSHLRIFERREERLADIEEGVWRGPTRRAYDRHYREYGSDPAYRQRRLELAHRPSLS